MLRASNTATKAIIVDPADWMTSDSIGQLELAALVAVRAAEIDRSGTHFATAGASNTSTAVQLAWDEIYSRQCPLKLRRLVGHDARGNPIYEERNVNELAIPHIAAAERYGVIGAARKLKPAGAASN